MKLHQRTQQNRPQKMAEGRHSVRIRSIVAVGPQRGYNGGPPTERLVFEFVRIDGVTIEKAVTISSHEASALGGIVYAAGFDINDADLDVRDLLGRALAIEVTGDTFPKVEGASPLEAFDDDVPELQQTLFIEDPSEVNKDNFRSLPPLARKLWGERIRSRQGEGE